MSMTKFKRCPTCDINQPADPLYFSRHANRHDGLHWQCKACRKNTDRLYRIKVKSGRIAARKKKVDKDKRAARELARSQWGKAAHWSCKVLGCLNRAEEFHHVDYSKPIDVIPLCRAHHELEHHKGD